MNKFFKNWPEICRLGENPRHHLLMMAIATIDLSGPCDEVILGSLLGFPWCFSEKEVAGPYPLSLIRSKAEEMAREQEGLMTGDAADFPNSHDSIPGHIPLQGFDKFGRSVAGFEGPLLPKTIDPDAPQGSVVTWEGKEFVVLENNRSCEELWIAPAECIRVDL